MGRQIGRPPLGCNRSLTVSLRPEVDDRIRAMSTAHGVPRRSIVRQLIEDALIEVGDLDPAVAAQWRHRHA